MSMRQIKRTGSLIVLVTLVLIVALFTFHALVSRVKDVGIWPNVLDLKRIDETPPSCITVRREREISILIQDNGGGLDTVNAVEQQNANVDIPSFRIGSRSPITVSVWKITQGLTSRVTLESIDISGNRRRCDPLDF